ncbi:MAG: fibronectin type III domain-containing protein [bacterium]|nr:fibronectin type III domain-containing protein [bacterium]
MKARFARFTALALLLCLTAITVTSALAQDTAPPAPVQEVIAEDNPNDRGHAVLVRWHPSPDDGTTGRVTEYRIYRARCLPGVQPEVAEFERVSICSPALGVGAELDFVDVSDEIENGIPYLYKIETHGSAGVSSTIIDEPVIATAQWFDKSRLTMLIAILIASSVIIYWIQKAQGNTNIYLRPVAGLKAFDEAVGRATEMGQPVLFVPGIMDMDQIETLAGVSILGYVANMTSRYETKLEVPVSRSLVMAHAREVVKESYLSSGRPDLYHDDMIHYLTDDQFAYAAAVDGIMLRDKPAACFYQGKFYAESLILAETGNSIGAIQIAGTASPAQLPFFITACDYTLIGEEFFAASAYLSNDMRHIGSIRGQDSIKMLFMIALAIGTIYVSLACLGVPLPNWLDMSLILDVSGS